MKIIYHETNKYGIKEIMVDDDIYEYIKYNKNGLSFYTENAKSEPYVNIRINGTRYPLHRFIMGIHLGTKYQIDHIDRHPLNNIRNNLKITDFSGNGKNRDCPRNNKSTGIIGISKHHDCLYASIRTGKVRISSKGFNIKKNGYERALYRAVKWRVSHALELGFTIPSEHLNILNNKPNPLLCISRFKSGINERTNRFVCNYYNCDGKRCSKSFGFKKYGTRENAYIEAKRFKKTY